MFLLSIYYFCIFLILFIKKPFIDEDDFSKLTIGIFVTYLFLIPLIEELCFRGVLSLSKKIFFVSLVAILIVLLCFFKFNFISLSIINLGILTLVNNDLIFRIKRFVDENIIIVIIITAILFSIAHLKNYESINVEAYLKSIPKFTGGLYLGYISYKYGISRSYILHGINNLIPFIIILIVKYFRF
ncbi:CPBP family glutamic-type intramembrane protease [Tenacibaculum dicentrarchi]|uniref:CPBP family glutamic-type intramembrane protease n=1 Tax=Tenacibaculum dicentrarchi TaxID=669041 RepID=UPI00351157B1